MLNERALYLINAEIDGELAAGERKELDAILESSHEARAMQAELRKLARLLEEEPEREPPPDLARRVMERLPAQRKRPAFSLAGWFTSLQPAPVAAAFAAGLLVAIGVYEVSSPGRGTDDIANMVGTMIAPRHQAEIVRKDRLELKAPGLAGTMSLGIQGDVFVLDVDVESSQQAEITIQLAEAGLGFGGVAHANAGGAGEESFQVSGGTMRVKSQGRQAFSVFLRQMADQGGRDREVAVAVSLDGRPVLSGALRG